MPATAESQRRTRSFARVIGPFIVLVPAIVILRAPDLTAILQSFFQNDALVWVMGALLLFCGLLIIAYHQYWSGAAAIIISLFGWFLTMRGLALLAVPQLIERGAYAAITVLPLVRAGFALLVLAGLWLSYVGWLVKPPESASSRM